MDLCGEMKGKGPGLGWWQKWLSWFKDAKPLFRMIGPPIPGPARAKARPGQEAKSLARVCSLLGWEGRHGGRASPSPVLYGRHSGVSSFPTCKLSMSLNPLAPERPDGGRTTNSIHRAEAGAEEALFKIQGLILRGLEDVPRCGPRGEGRKTRRAGPAYPTSQLVSIARAFSFPFHIELQLT